MRFRRASRDSAGDVGEDPNGGAGRGRDDFDDAPVLDGDDAVLGGGEVDEDLVVGGDDGGTLEEGGGFAGDVVGFEGDVSTTTSAALGVLGDSMTLEAVSLIGLEVVGIEGGRGLFLSTARWSDEAKRSLRFTLTGDLRGDVGGIFKRR